MRARPGMGGLDGSPQGGVQERAGHYQDVARWDGENEMGGVLAVVVVHTACHLGEVRQAMCLVKQQTSTPG